MKPIREAALQGIKWGMAEKLATYGVRFVLSLFVARLLSPADYGMAGIVAVVTVFGDAICECGLGNALVREKNPTQTDFSTIFYFNVLVGILCYGVLYAVAPWVEHFFDMPVSRLLRLMSVTVVLNSMMVVPTARLTVKLNFHTPARCSMLASMMSGIAGLVLACHGLGVWALAWQTVSYPFINLTCLTLLGRWMPSFAFSMSALRRMAGYGVKLLGAALLNKLYQNLTALFIGKFYTPAALGAYDRGTGVAAYAPDTVNGVMQKVIFPVLARYRDDKEQLLHTGRKYLKLLSLINFFICLLAAALARPLVLMVLGEHWAGAIVYMQIYSFSVCFCHIDAMNLNYLYVKGRSGMVLKLEMLKKLLSTVVLVALVPIGVVAICMARVLHTQIAIFCDSCYIRKLSGYGLMSQWRDIHRYLVSAIIATAPAFLFTLLEIPYMLMTGAGLASAGTIYYVLLRRDAIMMEGVDLIKERLRRRSLKISGE